MSGPTEVQALEKISTEVGDSQIKITLSSQCLKAQAFLADKLKKQSERQKELCSYVSKSNLKLHTEIIQAEIEIKSLMAAKETIKTSNIELKKWTLLLRERKQEIEERINDGGKKYENMWLEAKAHFENLPLVQKLFKAQNKIEPLKENILNLKNKSANLAKEIDTKKMLIANSDRERIVVLAQFMVYDLPKGMETLQEKMKEICYLKKNIDECNRKQANKLNISKSVTTSNSNQKDTNEIEKENNIMEDGWFDFYQVNQRDSVAMPQIQLIQSDFDALSAKLDKIKIKKSDMFNVTPAKRVNSSEPETGIHNKKFKTDAEFTIAFNENIFEKEGGELVSKKSFSKRKLINILEDVKIDACNAYEIVSKINFDQLKGVDKIGIDTNLEDQNSKLQEVNEDIEEVDSTKSENDILVPPTQFLDLGETNHFSSCQQRVEVTVHASMFDSPEKGNRIARNLQENKKNVCFDIPISIQEITEENEDCNNLVKSSSEHAISTNETEANETLESQVDVNLSDESYDKMKDIILKKHNLDLSPQFVYAKNSNLQTEKGTDEKIITSKFFQNDKIETVTQNEYLPETSESPQKSENIPTYQKGCDVYVDMKMDEVVVSTPKGNIKQKQERSVTGLLFNHGAQGIPDSLNTSISTTGFEEGDSDFPHCLDTSLLLSPKADYLLPASGQNTEVTSQEVPNFLSGLRRTAFSFFGQSAEPSESKPNTTEQKQTNFNFNFGDEKKGRGGLFNMFD